MISVTFLYVLILVLTICIAFSAFLFLVYWRKFRSCYWKWFGVFLAIKAFVEVATFILSVTNWVNGFDWNFIYSYILFPGEFLFFYWLFYRYFMLSKMRYLAIISAVVYLIAFLLNSFIFKEKWYAVFWFSYFIGEFFLLCLCFSFFLLDTSSLPPKRNSMFWVVLGLTFFFSFTSALSFLRLANFNVYLVDLYIIYVFNCLMYLFFSIGIIWGKIY